MRTGLVQVTLNPCDIWNAEELQLAIRAANSPLRMTGIQRFLTVVPRDRRVRCPGTFVEFDFDLIWNFGAREHRGTLTVLGQQALTASLDPTLQRPIHAEICYRNFQILRLSLPPAVSPVERTIRETFLRELSVRPAICVNMLARPVIGVI